MKKIKQLFRLKHFAPSVKLVFLSATLTEPMIRLLKEEFCLGDSLVTLRQEFKMNKFDSVIFRKCKSTRVSNFARESAMFTAQNFQAMKKEGESESKRARMGGIKGIVFFYSADKIDEFKTTLLDLVPAVEIWCVTAKSLPSEISKVTSLLVDSKPRRDDCLVLCTSMLAEGVNCQNVNLVGICGVYSISSLVQMSNRGGRGVEDMPTKVFVLDNSKLFGGKHSFGQALYEETQDVIGSESVRSLFSGDGCFIKRIEQRFNGFEGVDCGKCNICDPSLEQLLQEDPMSPPQRNPDGWDDDPTLSDFANDSWSLDLVQDSQTSSTSSILPLFSSPLKSSQESEYEMPNVDACVLGLGRVTAQEVTSWVSKLKVGLSGRGYDACFACGKEVGGFGKETVTCHPNECAFCKGCIPSGGCNLCFSPKHFSKDVWASLRTEDGRTWRDCLVYKSGLDGVSVCQFCNRTDCQRNQVTIGSWGRGNNWCNSFQTWRSLVIYLFNNHLDSLYGTFPFLEREVIKPRGLTGLLCWAGKTIVRIKGANVTCSTILVAWWWNKHQ